MPDEESEAMLDHEHPLPTRNHHYRYLFTQKHHGGHGDAQWLGTLGEPDEFAVFDGADDLDILDDDGNLYGALRDGVDSLRYLGIYQEQIAKFWKQPEGTAWHGFPVWAINSEGPGKLRKRPPPKEVFDRMLQVGLITDRAMRNRLRGGHHV
jgi:hypothetical protein